MQCYMQPGSIHNRVHHRVKIDLLLMLSFGFTWMHACMHACLAKHVCECASVHPPSPRLSMCMYVCGGGNVVVTAVPAQLIDQHMYIIGLQAFKGFKAIILSNVMSVVDSEGKNPWWDAIGYPGGYLGPAQPIPTPPQPTHPHLRMDANCTILGLAIAITGCPSYLQICKSFCMYAVTGSFRLSLVESFQDDPALV
jgi:hypothetical protein